MNIPVFQQEKTKTCGLASMRMILGFYGISATEQELASIVKLHSFGLTTFEVAQIANEYGFTCTAYTFKQSEYAPLGLKPGEEISKDITYKNKQYTKEITPFLEKNRIIFHHPSRSLYKKYLDSNIPIITAINSASLGLGFRRISQGHYVVPTEITTDSITFNDPWTGKANTVNIDRFLASVTIKAAGSEFLLAIEK
jgi:hypothetical protein